MPLLNKSMLSQLFKKDGSCAVDYIIYFESLGQGMAEICRMAGCPTPALPVSNVTQRRKHKGYKKYYNNDMVKMLRKKLDRDFDITGYKWGGNPDQHIKKIRDLIF